MILGPRTAIVIAAPSPLLLIPSAAQLAELVYEFCSEVRLVSDSAPPPRCCFESLVRPLTGFVLLSASLSRLPSVSLAVESEVADRAAALHRLL